MVNPYPPGYSFCIITDRKEPEKLKREIESIRALGMPDYEIIVQEDNDPPSGRTSRLRNQACKQAKYDHLIVVDDDMQFHPDFFQGLQQFGEDYDVAACRILNPDGSRFYDWKTYINGKNRLLDYDQSDPHISLTSGIYIMKHWVFEKVQWDEALGYYEGEDVDYSDRLKKAGVRISINTRCTVTHDANYIQGGRRVFRLDTTGRLKYSIYKLLNWLGMVK